MRRRTFLVGSLLLGCEATLESFPRFDSGSRDSAMPHDARSPDAAMPDAGLDAPTPVDAGAPDAFELPDTAPPDVPVDACPDRTVVTLHDTHAQALYFDGTYGPTTGIVRVADMVAARELTLEFWHGHGGRNHAFTIRPTDFEALRRGERVTLVTTEVDSHSHMLFIDPVDARWRVEGAVDETVEICG